VHLDQPTHPILALLTPLAGSAHSGRMGPQRLPDNQEDREVYLRDHRAGTSSRLSWASHRRAADTVIMTVKAFAGEPEVLYVALNYAYHSGMAVTMASDTEGEPNRDGTRQ
jgi:hypothetical protein